MIHFSFTHKAQKQFLQLDQSIQKRILRKLRDIQASESSQDCEIIYELEPATHRLRIGDYRLFLCQKGEEYIIIKVGHRGSVYR